MEVLGPEQTARLLPYERVADEIGSVLRARSSSRIEAPERTVVRLPNGGRLLVMSVSDPALTVVKVVTVHPENAVHGLPVIQGEALAVDSKTGQRLAVLDGATVTARRTAALSLLAAKSLLTRPADSVLIIGAGAQGTAHLEALAEGLGIARAYIASRTASHAEHLAQHGRTVLGIESQPIDEVEDVLADVDVVVTATTSKTPVLCAGVSSGTLILGVGSFTADASEVCSDVVKGAQVVVDSLEGARAEAGDLVLAAVEGVWSWDGAVELEQVLRGDAPPVGDRPVFFKSVGHALFDLAAAQVAVSGLVGAQRQPVPEDSPARNPRIGTSRKNGRE